MTYAMTVKIKTWPHFKGELPSYQSAGASGFDVRAQLGNQAMILTHLNHLPHMLSQYVFKLLHLIGNGFLFIQKNILQQLIF